MDFLTLSGDPWRICGDKLNTLADPTVELVASMVEVTLRVTYTDETDIVIPARKTITRRRVASEIRKHLRAEGRAEGGATHRDCFLVSVLPHETEDGVWVATIQNNVDLDLPSWQS